MMVLYLYVGYLEAWLRLAPLAIFYALIYSRLAPSIKSSLSKLETLSNTQTAD